MKNNFFMIWLDQIIRSDPGRWKKGFYQWPAAHNRIVRSRRTITERMNPPPESFALEWKKAVLIRF